MPHGFRFAHLSDPHLPLPPGLPARLRHLAGKRLLGFLSWRRKRHRLHLPDVLAALLADVERHAPDHVVVTGDLVNIALPDEFELARLWLEGLGAPERVSVVPGNHDATVAVPWGIGLGRWQPWMTGDGADAGGPAGFPYVRIRGPVAFVGVSTAVPTLPLLATGTVGTAQRARVEAVLNELAARGLFRVVLMHHPPLPVGGGARKGLTDRRAVQGVLARAGAELVLHGHHHRNHRGLLPGPGGRSIPVVGVASASGAEGHAHPARWIQFTVTARGEGGWHLAALVRGYGAGGFGTAERFAVSYDAPALAVCGQPAVSSGW
ncbi:metallophosphoesterase family protein [Azospirillum sp. ST 5-10]|uniref:metallophosphoesterase family protein n=1 Tax=unclassified Azospirillum TaxID=2630922 RepID=UPI003F4A78D6